MIYVYIIIYSKYFKVIQVFIWRWLPIFNSPWNVSLTLRRRTQRETEDSSMESEDRSGAAGPWRLRPIPTQFQEKLRMFSIVFLDLRMSPKTQRTSWGQANIRQFSKNSSAQVLGSERCCKRGGICERDLAETCEKQSNEEMGDLIKSCQFKYSASMCFLGTKHWILKK